MSALEKAIKHFGSQSALAEKIGCYQSKVWYWLNKQGHKVPAEYCKPIEIASNGAITASELRPDIFGTITQPRRARQSVYSETPTKSRLTSEVSG